MVISSFISSVLVLALGIWAYLRLESSMNLFAERQLLIEPSKFSFKMWKDMPVTMYQSFTFFNLTNWSQVKAIGQKPRFVEVGPYVYKTIWSKSDVNFLDEEKLVSFSEKKQWHFQAHLSRGYEEDLIWTINTPLMTALALIQNAPVITRNIVSVILDGLGEGAFIKRPIRGLLFEGYSDLIVSVGPLFDRRFANFNGKFAYLYNKNDTVDGHWTVATGQDDLANLNKITRFQSSIVNMTSFSSGQMPQGLNEVKAECAPAWSLDQSTNGQLFAPFNRDTEQQKLQRQLQQIKARAQSKQQQAEQQQQQQQQQQASDANSPIGQQQQQAGALTTMSSRPSESIVQAPKRFFSRISTSVSQANAQANNHQQTSDPHHHHHSHHSHHSHHQQQPQALQPHNSIQEKLQQLKDFGKYIFYPDLCRPIHLLPARQQVTSDNGIQASRYLIDPRVFMNSSQVQANKCYEMNPRPPLANALAATINSVTGANVQVPSLVTSASSPFALFIPPNHHHHHNQQQHHHHHHENGAGLFERANYPNSFLNNALHSLSASASQAVDQLASPSNNSPISRLGRVRQLFSNIVSQRMSANPLLPSLAAGPANLLMGNHHQHQHHLPAGPPLSATARNAGPDQFVPAASLLGQPLSRPLSAAQEAQHHHHHNHQLAGAGMSPLGANNLDNFQAGASNLMSASQAEAGANQLPPMQPAPAAAVGPGGSDRWITQFRFKWPRGVFSIGQCQLGAPIYVSLPHFLDADEYYLEQVDGLKPNRSLHEFYIDVESTLHSIPVGAKARLQLNVATPELRFRNIPNAMIPVLWQEVTFKIDKPVATMLYWSFTMSSTIYKVISVLLICGGLALLVLSFVGGFRSHTSSRRRRALAGLSSRVGRAGADACDTSQICPMDADQRDRVSCTSGSHQSDTTMGRRAAGGGSPHSEHHHHRQSQRGQEQKSPLARQQREGRRSSWQHMTLHGDRAGKERSLRRCVEAVPPNSHQQLVHCNHSTADSLDELRHGASLNRAFASSANEIHSDRNSSDGPVSSSESILTSPNHNSLSPRQTNWSRASSNCELVSASMGTAKRDVNCSGCLFACLRHSPNGQHANGSACQQAHTQAHRHEHLAIGTNHISGNQLATMPTPAPISHTAILGSDSGKASLSSSKSREFKP